MPAAAGGASDAGGCGPRALCLMSKGGSNPGRHLPRTASAGKTGAMRKRICTCPGVICNQFGIFSFVIKAMSGHTIESLYPIVMIRFRE